MKNLIVNNKNKSIIVVKFSNPNCPRMLANENFVAFRDDYSGKMRIKNIKLMKKLSSF